MSDQLLFEPDEARMSRKTDPATSKQAAHGAVESGLVKSHADAIFGCLLKTYGRTSGELAAIVEIPRSEVSKRTVELERAGRIVRGPARKCAVNGTMMATWTIV